MSSISAGLSQGTALVSTGDTTGELVLKTNGGTTAVTIGTDQSVTLAAGLTTASPTVISVNSTDPALRITQVGTGNALLVEDSANPDGTPLIVNTSGELVVGYTSSEPALFPNIKNIQSHATAGRAGFTAARWDNGANGPQLILAKSRGGAVGTNGIVSDGDILGQIYFAGDDGTDLVTAGALIEAEVDGTPGTNDMPGRLVFSTTADGASSPTERMRIDSSGNLKFNSGYGSVATAYGCRAWVNFNGTGTVAIRASGNVTSITDNGTGDYTVNFTTAMPDANYAGAAIGALDTSGAGALVSNVSVSRTGNQSTTAFRVQTYYWAPSSNTIADFTQVQIAIFR